MAKVISNLPGLTKPPFNSGTIIEDRSGAQWVVQVGPYALSLDIISIGPAQAGTEERGIASFVVMEQAQSFLNYIGGELAKAIADQLPDRPIVLLTAETKGAHLAPWLWHNLEALCGSRLEQRIITLRKGKKKPYMCRPVIVDAQEIFSPQVTYRSITSAQLQRLTISPKDLAHLLHLSQLNTMPIFVDDFIGQGGTVVAVHRLFEQLAIPPPQLVAAIGSDGALYEQTFAQEEIDVQLFPQPFPLTLPTFSRSAPAEPWTI